MIIYEAGIDTQEVIHYYFLWIHLSCGQVPGYIVLPLQVGDQLIIDYENILSKKHRLTFIGACKH
jgi:hypothetical protein